MYRILQCWVSDYTAISQGWRDIQLLSPRYQLWDATADIYHCTWKFLQSLWNLSHNYNNLHPPPCQSLELLVLGQMGLCTPREARSILCVDKAFSLLVQGLSLNWDLRIEFCFAQRMVNNTQQPTVSLGDRDRISRKLWWRMCMQASALAYPWVLTGYALNCSH